MDRINELADDSGRPIRVVAGWDKNKGTRVLEFDDEGYPILPISGTGADGKTLRRVWVDDYGRMYTAPNVIKQVSVTKTLACASNYSANHTMSESATAGLATCWTFNGMAGEKGGGGYITKGVIQDEVESITERATMFLFNSPVLTCNLLDSTANTAPDVADVTKYLGRIDFPAMDSVGSTDSNTVATPSTVGNLPLAFVCATGDDAIYGILVARDGSTHDAAENTTVTLTVEQM